MLRAICGVRKQVRPSVLCVQSGCCRRFIESKFCICCSAVSGLSAKRRASQRSAKTRPRRHERASLRTVSSEESFGGANWAACCSRSSMPFPARTGMTEQQETPQSKAKRTDCSACSIPSCSVLHGSLSSTKLRIRMCCFCSSRQADSKSASVICLLSRARVGSWAVSSPIATSS